MAMSHDPTTTDTLDLDYRKAFPRAFFCLTKVDSMGFEPIRTMSEYLHTTGIAPACRAAEPLLGRLASG